MFGGEIDLTKFSAKHIETLRMLKKHKGNLVEMAREMRVKTNMLRQRIHTIEYKTSLDPRVPSELDKLLEMIADQEPAPKAAEGSITLKPCNRPCRYRSNVYAVNSCDYCYLTGRMRGCPAGDACTKFEEGERMKPLEDESTIVMGFKDDQYEANLYAKARRRSLDDYKAKNHL